MSSECIKVADIEKLNERMNSMDRRIERLERNDDVLNKLVTSVEVLAERMINVNDNLDKVDKKVDNVSTDLTGLKGTVQEIQLEPAQDHKWFKRQVWGYVIIALLGAVVGKMLSVI